MKTYAEENKQPPFDWNAALADPPLKDSDGYLELVELAGAWVTCACGNHCSVIPRDPYGAPNDWILRQRGREFAFSVDNADWSKARATLAAIEQRSAVLLAEIAKENQP